MKSKNLDLLLAILLFTPIIGAGILVFIAFTGLVNWDYLTWVELYAIIVVSGLVIGETLKRRATVNSFGNL